MKFGFDLKGSFKLFLWTILNIKSFDLFNLFSKKKKKKQFQLGHWKICKKVKNAILKRSGDSIASKVTF